MHCFTFDAETESFTLRTRVRFTTIFCPKKSYAYYFGRYTNVDGGGFSVNMAKKQRAQYVCSSCGHTVSKWQGENATNVKSGIPLRSRLSHPTIDPTKGISNVKKVTPTLLTDVDMSDGEVRLKTGIGEQTVS